MAKKPEDEKPKGWIPDDWTPEAVVATKEEWENSLASQVRTPSRWDDTLEKLERGEIMKLEVPEGTKPANVRIALGRSAYFWTTPRGLLKLEYREQGNVLYVKKKTPKDAAPKG